MSRVGFVPDRDHAEPLPGKGYRFKKWTLLEVSLVSVGANQSAEITTVGSAA